MDECVEHLNTRDKSPIEVINIDVDDSVQPLNTAFRQVHGRDDGDVGRASVAKDAGGLLAESSTDVYQSSGLSLQVLSSSNPGLGELPHVRSTVRASSSVRVTSGKQTDANIGISYEAVHTNDEPESSLDDFNGKYADFQVNARKGSLIEEVDLNDSNNYCGNNDDNLYEDLSRDSTPALTINTGGSKTTSNGSSAASSASSTPAVVSVPSNKSGAENQFSPKMEVKEINFELMAPSSLVSTASSTAHQLSHALNTKHSDTFTHSLGPEWQSLVVSSIDLSFLNDSHANESSLSCGSFNGSSPNEFAASAQAPRSNAVSHSPMLSDPQNPYLTSEGAPSKQSSSEMCLDDELASFFDEIASSSICSGESVAPFSSLMAQLDESQPSVINQQSSDPLHDSF